MKTLQIALTITVLTVIGTTATKVQAQNPIVGGDRRTDVYYDPFNDHTYVNRESISVRESAFDPGRMYVDPGSKRYVDRYFRDSYGETVREFGWTWTSYGKPPGKLTRQRIRSYPNRRPGCNGGYPGGGGVTIDDRETVVFSQGNQGRPGNRPRPGYRPRPGHTTVKDNQTVIYSVNKNRGSKSQGGQKKNYRQNNNSKPRSNNKAGNQRRTTFRFNR